MKRAQSWDCQIIKIKPQVISSRELKQRLAELWELLVQNESQFQKMNPVPVRDYSLSPQALPLQKRRAR
jgi:hypothetical protein